ncbi:MAG: CPBP family intramembrane glutamic endopeptidase [Bacteroidota bacterium]
MSLSSVEPSPPFDPQSPMAVLLFFLLAIFMGSLIGNGLALALSAAWEIDIPTLLQSLNEESPYRERQFARYINLLSHSMSFTAPALATAIFFYRKDWSQFLRINKSPKWSNLLLGIALIIASFGVAHFTYWLNQQIPLPEWATKAEDTATNMIKGLLVMESPLEFLLNLLVMAVLPAIGEELLFRGVLQTKLEEWTRQAHLAIWITALIFSAFHLQFEGFLPRMLLGAILGYLFFWTRNLWIPIIGHFVFNGMQVVATYLYNGDLSKLEPEQVAGANWVGTLFSGLLAAYFCYIIVKRNQPNHEQSIP